MNKYLEICGSTCNLCVKAICKGILFTHGSVDYDFYLEVMKKFEKPKGNNVAGVDVNLDRINLAIVKDGELRDHKTFKRLRQEVCLSIELNQ